MDDPNPSARRLVQSNVTGKIKNWIKKNNNQLFVIGPSQPVGIAYDWVSDRLYWTDETYGRIISARNNGSERLIVAASSKPRAIVVHPCKGLVIIIYKRIKDDSILLNIDIYSGQMLVFIHQFVVQH
jgi:hypothetical protein